MKKQETTIDKDPLQEAVITARLMEEMHKGPGDAEIAAVSETDAQEDDAAESADDSGE